MKPSVLKSVRGMKDVLPEELAYWHDLEAVLQRLARSAGYREIRLPILEPTALFRRSVGEVTDIVEKEMYTFEDRNGDSLSLRPEGTAGCVRAGIEHGLLYHQTQRFWYLGPMFRHERPQKGRYRQFYQFGLEAFGMAGPEIDAEMIFLTARLWRELGIAHHVTLELNSLGTHAERATYRAVLVDYLHQYKHRLDEDSLKRLETNPLRVLDSKEISMELIIKQAPSLQDYLGEESLRHFERLQAILTKAGVAYQLNPRLVRGLDYYGSTVFEWVTRALGAQGTVCAGGRFDALVQQLGGHETPAVGLSVGIERVVALLELAGEPPAAHPHIYWVAVGEAAQEEALMLAEQLRTVLPELRLQLHCGPGNFKSQFKKADQSGALYAFVMGDNELADEALSIKPLRGNAEQCTVPLAKLADFCQSVFKALEGR